jgi:hypothetical protein
MGGILHKAVDILLFSLGQSKAADTRAENQ